MNLVKEILCDFVSLFCSSFDKQHSSVKYKYLTENDYSVIMVNFKDKVDEIFNG
ncbi:MAG TPA: hypothetical protein VJY62_10160 [Bacteroidia bacterium]|nr:hypothetical protein [Bacteroidia bacterium]